MANKLTKKAVPKLVIYRGEERPDVIYLTDKKLLVGTSNNNDVICRKNGLPKSYRLFGEKRGVFYLRLASWLNGTIQIGNNTIDLKEFARLHGTSGKIKKSVIYLSEDGKGSLNFGDIHIDFEFAVPPPPPPKPITIKRAKLPRELKRKYVTKDTRLFYVILILMTIIMSGFVYMVNTLTIKSAYSSTELSGIPPRLAKLLIRVPKPKQTFKGQAPQQTKQKEVPKEGGGAGKGKSSKPAAARTRQEMVAKVSSKGLLALIVSTGKSTGTTGDVLSQAPAMNLNKALKGISGFKVAGGAGELKQARGAGLVGGGAGIAGLGGGGRYIGLGTKKGGKIASISGGEEGGLNVKGGLSSDIIRQVVNSNLASIKYCYETGLKNNPELKGKVTVHFVIGADGSVTLSQIKRSTMNAPQVEQCIAIVIKRWIFPKPYNGGTVDVVFPFIFTPSLG